jgi:hypothetical protein
MKNYFTRAILAGVAIVLIQCEQDLHTIPSAAIKPVRLEEEGYSRELFFNNTGKQVHVKSATTMPDQSLIESVQELFYDETGRLAKTIIDNSWRMEYFYEGNKIILTDEYRNNAPYQFHTFSYNISGRLVEMVTLQNHHANAIPVSKIFNIYDLEGNLVESRSYAHEIDGFHLNTSFTYACYDDMLSGDHYFSAYALNPYVRFHTNNPGKMIVKNFNGMISTTEEYTYQYNIQGLPILRYTSVTFPHNRNVGMYKTEFFYETK